MMSRRRKTKVENDAVDNEATHAPGPNTSRRRFAKTLAAAAFIAPALAAKAQTPPATSEPKAPPQPQPTPAPQTQGPPAPSPLALAYFEVARQRFGASLTPEQLEAVKRDLEGNVRTAERLRASKLKNSDEPDFVFEA
jgi:hypothetical protein